MDRRRRRTRALGAGFALAAGAALAGDAGPPLHAMRWAARDADPVALFASQPAECLTRADDPAVEVGRAAFRTPLLLGGQAARAGLSCEACHRAGRGNPDFLFPGVSGAPGTADVTHSLFSARRGNAVHDPKPIPDLGGPRERLKVKGAALAPFIRGLVVEEFDGSEPSTATLEGLTAYVRALDPGACPPGRTPVTLRGAIADTRRALKAAQARLAAGDRATTILMIAAARAELGRIDERYPGMRAEQARLRAADARLAALQAAVREGRPEAFGGLAHWLESSTRLEAALAPREARSLFNPTRLAAAAKRRLPAEAS